MTNLWARLRGLFARDTAISRVEVLLVASNGTSTVKTPTSQPYVVLGDAVPAGGHALVQGGRIIGAAAALPYYEVNV